MTNFTLSMITRFCLTIFLYISMVSCQNTQQTPTNNEVENVDKPTNSTVVNTAQKKKSILFFGDSLTAGFGLEEEESFPSLVQDRIDSLDLEYHVINAGLSGETSSGGKNRIDWVFNQEIDIFVLELGANDMLRGLDIVETEKNLRAICTFVKDKSPQTKLVIAGMEAPPNMGTDYTTQFRGLFQNIANDFDASLIPFLLDGVAGIPDLNLRDGKHPNAQGQKIVLENVWKVIQPLLI